MEASSKPLILKKRNFNQAKIEKRLKEIEKKIEKYFSELEKMTRMNPAFLLCLPKN